MEIEVVRIPALSDNYIWLAHDAVSGETIVVDPAVAEPVLEAAAARCWTISAIWNTHWHPDHTGGNAAIKAATGCTVIAPAAEAAKIPTADRLVAEGDTVMLGEFKAEVVDVPAHTAGHIAYHLPEAQIVFVGDTLFAMGCGRLFEGTAAQMFTNMQRLAALPGDTTVYCAHEYRNRMAATRWWRNRTMQRWSNGWPKSTRCAPRACPPSRPRLRSNARPTPSCAPLRQSNWPSAARPRTASGVSASAYSTSPRDRPTPRLPPRW